VQVFRFVPASLWVDAAESLSLLEAFGKALTRTGGIGKAISGGQRIQGRESCHWGMCRVNLSLDHFGKGFCFDARQLS